MTRVMGPKRRLLFRAALGFLRLQPASAEVAPLRRWLDSWAGVGTVIDGMVRQGFDVALSRNGDAGWRALFYPASFIHVSRAGSAWGTTPWQAVQESAWQALNGSAPWPVIEGVAGTLKCSRQRSNRLYLTFD